MKKLLLLSTALFIHAGAIAQLQNTDFERWVLPIEGNSIGNNRPVGWLRTNGSPVNHEYFYHDPVTAAQSGNYALRMSIWYTYDEDMAIQTAPINYRPSALTGFYTYTDNVVVSPFTNETVDDEARVTVKLTKVNAGGAVEVIGTGSIVLPSARAYAPFVCPISYTSTAIPDAIEVLFDASLLDRSGGGTFVSPFSSGVSSILTIDNIALSTEILSNPNPIKDKWILYPNPATDFVYVPNFEGNATIYDFTGKMVAKHQGAFEKIDVSALQTGMYIIALNNSEGVQTAKLIKQ